MKHRFGWTCIALFLVISTLAISTNPLTLSSESEVPLEARRGMEQTLLTYPEWFLVFSPAEYAAFIARRPAHEFPFNAHIGQVWAGYFAVAKEQLRSKLPLNIGYHVMICVIATSTTIEYALHSAYENTLGRVSWALSSEKATAEDQYAAKVAQEYVDFIRHDPWYLFDFPNRLKVLWTDTPAWEANLIRKWERRYALTTEYAAKAIYAQLIKWATRSAYEPALATTEVIVDTAAQPLPIKLPAQVQVLKTLPNQRVLLSLPRYFDFQIATTELAQQGIRIVDIAGNTSDILLTVWADANQKIDPEKGRILFEQPIVTVPEKRRIALLIPVGNLSDFLTMAANAGISVEHVYDY